MNIRIVHDILTDNFYHWEGFQNSESRRYLPLPQKFRMYLTHKLAKFIIKYKVDFIRFVLGQDIEYNIEVLSICHSRFDGWSEKIGEDIVVGRIKRMRGDIPKREPYNLTKRYRIKHEDGTITAGELCYPYIYKLER